MFHVDNNSGVANMPELAPAQSNTTTWFTEGDGQKGISWIGQDWLNILQAELLNILAEASIQPDKAQLNQLTLSIKAIIAANAFSRKNNLKEIADAGAEAQRLARGYLGLGTLATKNSLGPADVNALAKDQNLADLENAETARNNLDVYSRSEGDNRYLRRDQNGADIQDKGTFIDNLRFEEITRTPLEVQDCLLGMLSDRVMTVPELTGEASQLYAREGFNIIATANTRDRGVNEMSAALKRRFDFETVFPIMDFAQELELVASASARLLAHSGIPHKVPDAVLELLVRTFRDLRANGEKKTSMDTLTAIMSTAEAVNVAHAVGVRAWFLANRAGEPADLVDCIAGTIVKDNEEDRARLRRYFEQRVATHKEAHWQAYYQARHRLP
ncbi:TPA: AAA family ATPase [Escherichia coli]